MNPKIPFALHAIVETAAALSFMITPEKQIPGCSEATRLVLRQYGGLLLSTNYICIFILCQPHFSDTGRLIAAALGTYHGWPSYRAYVRLTRKLPEDAASGSILGGPWLHLVLHILLLVLFLWASIRS